MELAAEKREILGRQVRALRAQGLIPAELYGHGLENKHLSVSAKDFLKILKEAGENTVVTVAVGKEKLPTLIHDVMRDPVSDEILNVDFYQVRLDEKIRTKIPVEFIGEAPAVKEKEGILVKSLQEIEVEALPGDLPHDIKVDISALADIDQSIYVKDLPVSANVRIVVDPETVVATVTAKAAEEEVPVAPITVDQVVVETEEKKAEREAKKAASGSAAFALHACCGV